VIGFLIQLSSYPQCRINAQFGVPKDAEAEVGADGRVRLPDEVLAVAESLVTVDTSMDQQDAVDIATIIDAAKKDANTKTMLAEMKAANPKEFEATAGSEKVELVRGLLQAYEELKLLDTLFQDPERALRLMVEEGMVEKEKIPMYEKNPQQLETDTRKGLYFMFVALAEAAGYF